MRAVFTGARRGLVRVFGSYHGSNPRVYPNARHYPPAFAALQQICGIAPTVEDALPLGGK
jgi:hypothetical protein